MDWSVQNKLIFSRMYLIISISSGEEELEIVDAMGCVLNLLSELIRAQ